METLATVKTEQNISIVQNAYADFAKGNFKAVADACTDDVIWGTFENKDVPYGGLYHGKKGVVDFFTTLAGNIDYLEFEPKQFFADKDRVFVKGYHKGKVKSTGKTFGHDFLMEFQLRDGKACSFFAYVDTRDQTAAFTN
ncbi:MAG TPA: nuclear transport factor 2 family protein [Chitinophagaceae bacterium]|nr:nuclear transport factor 2 family protein [Chitinophagaceae bacterium]